MRLVPHGRLVLRSLLTPDEVYRRLASVSTPPPFFSWRDSRLLQGKIRPGSGFRLSCRGGWRRNSFRPVALGRVTADGRGARIELSVIPNAMSFMVMAGVLAGPPLAVLLARTPLRGPDFFVFQAVVLGVFYLANLIGFWSSVPQLRRALTDTVDGEAAGEE